MCSPILDSFLQRRPLVQLTILTSKNLRERERERERGEREREREREEWERGSEREREREREERETGEWERERERKRKKERERKREKDSLQRQAKETPPPLAKKSLKSPEIIELRKCHNLSDKAVSIAKYRTQTLKILFTPDGPLLLTIQTSLVRRCGSWSDKAFRRSNPQSPACNTHRRNPRMKPPL